MAKARFTQEQVEAAVNSNSGSVARAARDLRCSDVTIYKYLGRTAEAKKPNGHEVKTNGDLAATLRLSAEYHEAQAKKIRTALATLLG